MAQHDGGISHYVIFPLVPSSAIDRALPSTCQASGTISRNVTMPSVAAVGDQRYFAQHLGVATAGRPWSASSDSPVNIEPGALPRSPVAVAAHLCAVRLPGIVLDRPRPFADGVERIGEVGPARHAVDPGGRVESAASRSQP